MQVPLNWIIRLHAEDITRSPDNWNLTYSSSVGSCSDSHNPKDCELTIKDDVTISAMFEEIY